MSKDGERIATLEANHKNIAVVAQQCPVPINEETGQPTMTELQWVKSCLVKYARDRYIEGKRMLAREAALSINEHVVTG